MITQEKVKEFFDYKNGNLIWRKTLKKNQVCVGDVAGGIDSNGYRIIKVDGRHYKAHRLVWLWFYGYFPEGFLDHKDKNRSNNKIDNLREASRQCNIRNCGNYKNNTSGVKGVWWVSRDRKWAVEIVIDGKRVRLGWFKDFTEAVAHRLAAEQAENWKSCESSSPAYLFMKKYLSKLKR